MRRPRLLLPPSRVRTRLPGSLRALVLVLSAGLALPVSLAPSTAAAQSKSAKRRLPTSRTKPKTSSANDGRALLSLGSLTSAPLPLLIRSLGASKSPSAAADLKSLVESEFIEASHPPESSLGLEMVFALWAHPTSDEARKGLVLLLERSGDPKPGEVLAEGRVRHTAALALAQSGNPKALAYLLAVASGPGELDEARKRYAQSALRAYPPRESSAAWEKLQHELELGPALSFVNCPKGASELELLAAKTGKNSQEQRSESLSGLRLLAACPLKPEWLTRAFFDDAFSRDPVWTLRAAAITARRYPQGWLTDWGKAQASSVLQGSGPSLPERSARSAAAFVLASLSQDEAETLAKSTIPEVSAAAKNQLLVRQEGPLAGASSSLSSSLSSSPAPSTRSLRDAVGAASSEAEQQQLVALLAARVTTHPEQNPGPTVAAVRAAYLSGSPAQRASLAAHLGTATAPPVARRLLSELYLSEGADPVRRMLCLSLARVGLPQSSPVAERILFLDPDPGCRAQSFPGSLPSGAPPLPKSPHTSASAIFLATSAGASAPVSRYLGLALTVTPAPDGFVGLIAYPDASHPGDAQPFSVCDLLETEGPCDGSSVPPP